jgi:hypothetical protein
MAEEDGGDSMRWWAIVRIEEGHSLSPIYALSIPGQVIPLSVPSGLRLSDLRVEHRGEYVKLSFSEPSWFRRFLRLIHAS